MQGGCAMNIFVLLKQIPMISDIRIDSKTFTVDRSQASNITNPSDLNALQAALSYKKLYGGSITVLSMGNETVDIQLRDAIARGADQAVRISDPNYAKADTLVTARILSSAIQLLGDADLIFTGQHALDSATGQISGKLSEYLNKTLLHSASKIDFFEDHITIHRKTGTGYELWDAHLPLLCSVVEGANELGSVTVKGKMAAKKADIKVLTNADLNLNENDLISPSMVEALFPMPEKETGLNLTGSNESESASKLAEMLFANHFA